jgi:predicted KAP-like P-loop ATPase
MEEMTDKQFDAILIAIINYAKDVNDIDKVIDYIEEMLTQTKKTGEPLKK